MQAYASCTTCYFAHLQAWAADQHGKVYLRTYDVRDLVARDLGGATGGCEFRRMTGPCEAVSQAEPSILRQ